MPGLYFHIPFCQIKCGYCDFYSFAPTSAQMDAYRDALCRSIADFAADVTEPFDSVYFGGGTPSFFGGERLKEVLETAAAVFPLSPDVEITVECNPSSATLPLFQTLKAAGVNRVSLGVQSALDKERKLLGRASNRAQVEAAVNACRATGIDNLSLDLMLGIPAQTKETLDESLAFLLSLQPQHISAYLLKVEEGTPLAAQKASLPLPDEDSVCELYLHAADVLEANGLRQYEISNFALPGFESRHNLHYWLARRGIPRPRPGSALILGRQTVLLSPRFRSVFARQRPGARRRRRRQRGILHAAAAPDRRAFRQRVFHPLQRTPAAENV